MISKKTDRIIRIIIVIAAIITVAGMSYSLLRTSIHGEKNYVLSSTGLKVYLDESKTLADIMGENIIPMSDNHGLEQETYTFSIHNDTKTSIDYNIYLVIEDNSTMPIYGVRYNLVNDLELNKTDYIDSNSNDIGFILYNESISGQTIQNYGLKLWLGSRAGNDCKNKFFSAHIVVDTTQKFQHKYTENILNGTDPVLKDTLVPVTISSTGEVRKANVFEKWYSYNENIWANAVILKDESKKFKDNEVISEDDIESYFVWIPKFDYQIFNMGSYTALGTLTDATQTINIRFGLNNTVDNDTECAYPIEDNQAVAGGGIDNCAIGKWMTHPAFTTMSVPGFWVGKFETGYDGATTTATAQVDKLHISNIIIKPNVYSWRNITAGKIFNISYNYKRNLDSHAMKNTEWGAVSYLSASKYGYKDYISTNIERKTPIVNNNIAYITGYAATEEPTKGYNASSVAGDRQETTALLVDGTYTKNYLNTYSQLASTTGNYSGVYDISGGAWDFVMGYTTGATTVGGSSGILDIYPSFFTDSNYYKYWDRYTSTAATNYSKRILGDATGEMGTFQSTNVSEGSARQKSSWYNDYAYYATSANPFIARGGQFNYGIETGIFAFTNWTGKIGTDVSFRIVLSPKEVS